MCEVFYNYNRDYAIDNTYLLDDGTAKEICAFLFLETRKCNNYDSCDSILCSLYQFVGHCSALLREIERKLYFILAIVRRTIDMLDIVRIISKWRLQGQKIP